jgi:hypothetical protein
MKMKKDDKIPDNYNELFHEIKRLIHISQYEALKSVNKKLISLYWSIGEMITLRQAGNNMIFICQSPSITWRWYMNLKGNTKKQNLCIRKI